MLQASELSGRHDKASFDRAKAELNNCLQQIGGQASLKGGEGGRRENGARDFRAILSTDHVVGAVMVSLEDIDPDTERAARAFVAKVARQCYVNPALLRNISREGVRL